MENSGEKITIRSQRPCWCPRKGACADYKNGKCQYCMNKPAEHRLRSWRRKFSLYPQQGELLLHAIAVLGYRDFPEWAKDMYNRTIRRADAVEKKLQGKEARTA